MLNFQENLQELINKEKLAEGNTNSLLLTAKMTVTRSAVHVF